MTAADRAADAGGQALVRPFDGLLVTPDWAERVVSPMLDAVRPAQRAGLLAELLADRPDSWLHVTAGALRGSDPAEQRGADEFGAGESGAAERGAAERAAAERGAAERGAATGAAALRRLLDEGAFAEQPAGVFVYRIADRRGSHAGLVVDVAAEAFVDGRVRGHEAVQPERVASVLGYFTAVPARSELVALLRHEDDRVDDVMARACDGAPLLDFTSADGLRQTVWRVSDEDAALVVGRLDDHPLYVADGHHRVAATLRAREQQGIGRQAGVPCVLFAPGGLRLESFHRRVRGPVEPARLLAELRARVAVAATDGPRASVGVVAMYVDGQWWTVRLPAEGADRPGVAGLDVARLQDDVLAPLLSVSAVSDPRLEVVPATAPLEGLVACCDEDGGVLFALAAPSVAQLIEVADRHEVMLPKSTFFEPKPQAGIFLEVMAD